MGGPEDPRLRQDEYDIIARPVKLSERLSQFGPGLLLAATGIGVGDMVSSTIAGAEFGLTLVWALVFGVIIKFAITEGAARWQLATGTTLIEGWRDELPDVLVAAFFVYFIVWSYFVSSALVTASALVPAAIMPAVPLWVWGTIHAVAAVTMVWFGRYERFLGVIKWFVGLKFVAIIASVVLILVWSGADWSGVGARSPFSVAYTLSLIGGVGGTVTLLSYAYWMREAGWAGPGRVASARTDLTMSFALVFVFCFSMIFLSTQIEWTGQILEEGPRLCLLLADRIGREIGPIGRAVFLLGFWGAAFSSVMGVYHGVPFLFDDMLHVWRRKPALGQQGSAYRAWAVYLGLAAVSALLLRRPVWLVFAYTVVGSLFFPFVISTLLWMNNSARVPPALRNRTLVNAVLGLALLLYVYLAGESALEAAGSVRAFLDV
jgi:Mn2+/Fe2+ NRAMP family transporter